MRPSKTRSQPPSAEAPERPATPILLVPLAFAWAGVAVSEALKWRGWCMGVDVASGLLAPGIAPAFAIAGITGLAATAFLRVRGASGRNGALALAVLALGALALGLACGALYWHAWTVDARTLSAAGGGRRTYEICSDPSERRYGQVSLARVGVGGRMAFVRVSWPNGEAAPMGSVVEAYGSLSCPDSDESGRWYHQSGCIGSVSLRGVERVGWRAGLLGAIGRVRERMQDAFDRIEGPGAALLSGVVLGDRSRLAASAIQEDFRICGLAHLVAVSGTHLSVVAGIALWVLARTHASHRLRFILTIAPAGCYAVLTGLAPSAVRALAMLSLGLGAALAGRRRDAGSALAFGALAMLVLQPANAFSLGFALSVCSVMGLVLFQPLFAAWMRAVLPGAFGAAADLLALTCTAQFSTLPLAIPAFSLIPLASPVANLVCAPIVSAMICLGVPAACASLVPALAPVAGFCLEVASAMGNLAADVAHLIAGLPLSALPVSASQPAAGVVGVMAASALWAFWPLPTKAAARRLACCLAAMMLAVALPIPVGPQIVMLDVGQGDAVLVRDGRAAVLVDTGPEYGGLLEELARNRIRRLDAVVITHLHDDHYGALADLYGAVEVGRVVFAGGVEDLAAAAGERGAVARQVLGRARRVADDVAFTEVGDCIRVGRFSLSVVSPESFSDDGGNPDSLVFAVACDVDRDGAADATALFTGDAEADVTGRLVASGAVGRVDILKVGHHGSKASVEGGVASALSPTLALISCGTGNRYGHPHPQCVSDLEEAGALVLRTDLDGQIRVSVGRRGLSVRCDSPPWMDEAA